MPCASYRGFARLDRVSGSSPLLSVRGAVRRRGSDGGPGRRLGKSRIEDATMSFRCAAALTFALAAAAPAVAQDVDERQIARAVMRHVALLVPANGADGAAVVVQANGRTTIYSFGMA